MKILAALLLMSVSALAAPKSAIIGVEGLTINVPVNRVLTIHEYTPLAGNGIFTIAINGKTINNQPVKLGGPAVLTITNNPGSNQILNAFITYEIGVK